MKQTEKYKMRFGASIMGDTDYIMIRDEFLKSKKVLTRFKRLEKDEGFGCYEVENARQLITTFNWTNTSEGYSYWYKIHTEWLEYIGIFGKYNNLQQYEKALEINPYETYNFACYFSIKNQNAAYCRQSHALSKRPSEKQNHRWPSPQP